MQIRAQGARASYLLLKKMGRKVADYNRKIGEYGRKCAVLNRVGYLSRPFFI